MDTNFALVVFALTVIVVVAIIKENDGIAQKATDGLVEIARGLIHTMKNIVK